MKTKNNLFYLTLLLTFIFFSVSSYSQKKSDKPEKEKKEKTYSDVINDKAITDIGLFDVHKVEDKYYYEINLHE